MDIQQIWAYVMEILAALDIVAIILVYFITDQLKVMVAKKYRRLTPLGVSIAVVLAIMWAAPTQGPFAGHIQYREGFIYTLVYFAMALAMRHLIKRFGRGEYDLSTKPDRREQR